MLAACQTEAAVETFSSGVGSENIKAFKMDLLDEAEVKAVAARLKAELPGGALYAVVLNNNNTVVGRDGLVEWMDVSNYQWYVARNRCLGRRGQCDRLELTFLYVLLRPRPWQANGGEPLRLHPGDQSLPAPPQGS